MVIFIAGMKRCLIILVVCSGFFSQVRGQSPSAAIDSLIKYRVITPKQRTVLEKEQVRYKGFASERVAILLGLYSIILQKTFHINPHKGYAFSYNFSDGYLNKKSQDSINTSLRRLLEKINTAGLLTDRVYTYTLKGIDSGRYVAEVQMIGRLTEMSSRLEWLTPGRLLPVAEQLHKNGIVSDSSFLRLKSDINSGKIESSFQLNDYCKLDWVFDLAKYPENPDVWLEQMHRDIASIVPGLNFTHFSYIKIPDTSFSIPGVRFKVSLISNGHIYKHTSLAFNNYKSRQDKIVPKDIFVQDFYRIFNKILTDQQSPLRLHDIMFSPGKMMDDNSGHFALIALTAEQAKIFMEDPCDSYMLVSLDNYDNTLTSARVDSAIAGWRKIGLFAHLTEAEIIKAIENTEADDWFSINNLLSNFPGVIYPLDSSITTPHHPYVNLLSHLARITHGAFNPTKISKRKVNGGVKLQYLSNGKIHSYTFKTAYGWLDDKFFSFMAHLGQENNLPGNFYGLSDSNAIIYLTKQQHDEAIKYKLLDLVRS